MATPTPIEAAVEALRKGSGVTHPWAMSITPQMLTAALDAVDMAKVLAETSRCVWGIADPKHPYGKDCLDDHPDKHPGVGYCWLLPRRQADAIRAALLEGSGR